MNLNNMTNEELIELYRKNNCHNTLTQLYNNNKGIIFNTASSFKHYDNITLNFENYLSMAHVGFMKAVNAYDSKSGKFSTLLTISTKREIQRLFIDVNRKKRDNGYEIISFQNKPYLNSDYGDFNDVVSYEDEKFGKPFAELNELYDELKPLLTDKQLIVLDMLNEGLGEVKIAEKLNTSRQNVHARVEQIRRKIIKHGLL